MSNPRRTWQPDQLSLFQPVRNRPQWGMLPHESREGVVRLLVQVLRDHVKRQQVDRRDAGADDE